MQGQKSNLLVKSVSEKLITKMKQKTVCTQRKILFTKLYLILEAIKNILTTLKFNLNLNIKMKTKKSVWVIWPT